jgi:RHS repeat-associated protein
MQNLRTVINKKPSSHFGAFSNKCTKSKKLPLKSNTITYLFAFNGKEQDNETYGAGNAYDFGARIYDARLGRWMSVDPLASEYPSLSDYSFVGNMPIIAIDPDGEKIVIVYRENGKKHKVEYQPGMKYEGDNKFVKETIAALEYVKAGDVKGIIGKLVNHEKTIKIKKTSIGSDEYNKLTNTVKYNPQSGLSVIDTETEEPTGGKQTPALGLLHELGHGFVDFFKSKKEKRKLNKPDNDYDTKEEKFVIDEIETLAAIILGEGVRKNHSGETLKTKSSTTTEAAPSKKELRKMKKEAKMKT